MAGNPYRTSWLGRLAVAASVGLLAAALWHARQMRTEQRLANLGGEVSYRRTNGLLSKRLEASGSSTLAREAPRVLDRLFGKIVAVDFGRVADLSDQPSRPVVDALLELDSVEVVMIEGLPIADARLLELTGLPALRQLGLKGTKVTAEGVAAFRQKRPDVELHWLDAPKALPAGSPAPAPAGPTPSRTP